MTVSFKRDKVSYTLLVLPRSKREAENVTVAADPKLWTRTGKRKSGLFCKERDKINT